MDSLNGFLISNDLLSQRVLLISLILAVGHSAILTELHALICLIFCLTKQHSSYGHQSWTTEWWSRCGNQPLDLMGNLFHLQESKKDRVSIC